MTVRSLGSVGVMVLSVVGAGAPALASSSSFLGSSSELITGGASHPRGQDAPSSAAEPSIRSDEATQETAGGTGSEGEPLVRSVETVDEIQPATDLSEIADAIDGPPPPVPPAVIARDAQGRVTIRAIRLTRGLRLDGRLDEAVYESAQAVTGFIQNLPNPGQPASEKTEAWIFFDGDNLYAAARCWESVPESQWVATDMRRDRPGASDDTFGVTIDTFHDRRNGYKLYTNTLGSLADAQVTDEGRSNFDWNTVWDVRTGRFEGGWSVEMRIPFKSLRYRPGASQIWGLQLRRTIRRLAESAHITLLPATSGASAWNRISMEATLVGLEVPPGSKNLEIKPYGISRLTTDRTAEPIVSNDLAGDVGVDVKYGVTQNVTVDFTYNTDFAQVEVDEQQINLTRFNLLFPEKREFFLEARGLFEFGRGTSTRGRGGNIPDLFFSRQIGLNKGRAVPIVAGARLTGRMGRLSVGALNLQTDDEPVSGATATNFTALRVKQDILRRSSVGMIFTRRSRSQVNQEASNEAYGVDAAFAFYENVNFNGYYARTETRGLAGKNESYQGRFDYNADRYGVQADHLVVGDAFNPEVGFVRRHDMRRTFVSGRFSPRPRSIEVVRKFTWDGSLEYVTNTAGLLETRQGAVGFNTEWENSDQVSVSAARNFERLFSPFEISPGVTIPVGDYDFDEMRASYTFGNQRNVSGSFSFEHGGFYGGERTAVGLSRGQIRITRQLSIEPSASINWVDLPYGSFTTRLFRARLTHTFTPRMFFSGFVQFNSHNDTITANLRLRWEYSPGSELFVVYTDDRYLQGPAGRWSELLNRAFVIKINRLIRF